jgi:hypothetical protein
MADQKISSMTYAIFLAGTERVPIVQAGTNFSASTLQISQLSARPYKVYTAYINQSGTSAPVATILENSLSGPIVWTRSGTGIYIGTLVAAFPSANIWIAPSVTGATLVLIGASTFAQFQVERLTDDTIRIENSSGTAASQSSADGLLINFPIEVRVYN